MKSLVASLLILTIVGLPQYVKCSNQPQKELFSQCKRSEKCVDRELCKIHAKDVKTEYVNTCKEDEHDGSISV